MIAFGMLLVTGILLGCWDVLKKRALKEQGVVSVLAAYSLLAFIFVAYEAGAALTIEISTFLLLALKSLIVYGAWNLMFLAIKNLPISIITPFNTVTPLCSIILGIIVLNESLTPVQWMGIGVMFVAYYFISKVGKLEVKYIFKNKYFYCMILGAMLNSVSGLIDKMTVERTTGIIMQFWFLFFMAVFYSVTFLVGKYIRKQSLKLSFDRNIVGMSLLIVVADRIYFAALNMPGTPISIAMPLRSVSIVVSVIVGGLIFKESNLKKKLMCTGILLVGILLLFL